ncbi:hypothetical protein D3C76_238850 [compost metagenome]
MRIDDNEVMSRDEGFEEIIRQETAGALRREIAFLSHQHGGMKISEIAAGMGLSSGTINRYTGSDEGSGVRSPYSHETGRGAGFFVLSG